MSNDHEHAHITTVGMDDPRMQPKAKNPDRVAGWIAFILFVGILGVAGFGAAYWVDANPWVIGATLGVGMGCIGYGMTAWGKYLMPEGPFVEERHELASSEDEREAMAAALVERGGGAFQRRKLLAGLLGGGMGIFGIVAIFPLLRSLGPLPGKTLEETNWKRGSRLVYQDGRGVHIDDLTVGGLATVFPKGQERTPEGQAVDQTVIVRIAEDDYTTRPGRETWSPKGYVAYSKLCTHLGCPVGLYEQALELLVCPCHQSMFDVKNGGMPTFGPAPRPLPQLPLYVDEDGYLRSQGGYHEPVGPGYWERS